MRWYYGWNIIGAGLVFQAVTFGLVFFSFTFWVGPWMADFGVSRTTVMWAFTAFNLGMGLMAPFAGRAMDKMSIRALVCGGSICFASGLALVSLATAFWQVIAIYATVITLGVILTSSLPAQTLAAKWFRANRGLAIGFVAVGTSIGGFLLPPVVAGLIADYGWRTANVMLAAGAVLVVVPLVWLVVRNTPEDKGVEPEAERLSADGSHVEVEFPDWTTAMILRQSSFWVPIGAFFPMLLAVSSIQANLAPFASDLGIDAPRAAGLMSALAGTMIFGKLFFGAMADRWDHRILFWISAATMWAAIFLFDTMPSYPVMVVASGTFGFAIGGFLPLLGAIFASRFGPHAFGRVMGLTGPIITITAIGPVGAGLIRDASGSYSMAFEAFLILIVPAALIMYFLRPPSEVIAKANGLAGDIEKAAAE